MVFAGLMWLASVPGWGWVLGISFIILVWCLWANRDSESDPFGIDQSDDDDFFYLLSEIEDDVVEEAAPSKS